MCFGFRADEAGGFERGTRGGEGTGKGNGPNSKLNFKTKVTKDKAAVQRSRRTPNKRQNRHQQLVKQMQKKRQNAEASSVEIRRSGAAAWI